MQSRTELPYLERILEARARGSSALSRLFDRSIHWGYWERPTEATLDPDEFVQATERMNTEILAAAQLADGQSLLDVGCGFGGTLRAVMAARRNMQLVGLGNDPRQLEVARQTASPNSECSIEFVVGDACSLPFAASRFDRVLAVESIFHFRSRAAFLVEAARVLRPGGLLVVSDLVPVQLNGGAPLLRRMVERIREGYGGGGQGWIEGSYAEMANAARLDVTLDRDITHHTLPTYPVVIADFREVEAGGAEPSVALATELLENATRFGMIRYRILAFAKR